MNKAERCFCLHDGGDRHWHPLLSRCCEGQTKAIFAVRYGKAWEGCHISCETKGNRFPRKRWGRMCIPANIYMAFENTPPYFYFVWRLIKRLRSLFTFQEHSMGSHSPSCLPGAWNLRGRRSVGSMWSAVVGWLHVLSERGITGTLIPSPEGETRWP